MNTENYAQQGKNYTSTVGGERGKAVESIHIDITAVLG